MHLRICEFYAFIMLSLDNIDKIIVKISDDFVSRRFVLYSAIYLICLCSVKFDISISLVGYQSFKIHKHESKAMHAFC